VAIKLTVIVAVLLGLVTYSRSSDLSGSPGPSVAPIKNAMLRAGYVEVEQIPQPKGLLVETFELRITTKPHYHTVGWIDLTSRGDRLVNFSHHGTYSDIPD
jgi:hypothetical protein